MCPTNAVSLKPGLNLVKHLNEVLIRIWNRLCITNTIMLKILDSSIKNYKLFSLPLT